MRGINFAGALDRDDPSPPSDRHLDVVRDAGFDTVRLPVKGTVHPAFPDLVDRAVHAALERGLDVVLDVHHFNDDAARLPSLWAQIARRYASAPPGLHFELLNEPHDPMTAGPVRWYTLGALPQPMFLGEFGVIDRAALDERAEWTALVRSEAERLGMSWAYWDFGTDFDAYDVTRDAWRAPLREALLGDEFRAAGPSPWT